jgi:histidinol phosphatase-like PHP family hydrolase
MIIQDALSNSFQLSISQPGQALQVSRSGYCKWKKEPEAIPSKNSENVNLKDEIQEIALEFPGYGYRRITAKLQNRGYAVNHKIEAVTAANEALQGFKILVGTEVDIKADGKLDYPDKIRPGATWRWPQCILASNRRKGPSP